MLDSEPYTIRVLHVDDDVSILDISKAILKDIDSTLDIDHALGVDEALQKLAANGYDVVVSDFEMPQKDGLAFLREIRKKNNKIPFVMFTGKGREEVVIDALNLGADGYVNKQGSPETVYRELTHNIRMSVEKSRAEEKYQSLFENAIDVIFTHSLDGNINTANKAIETYGFQKGNFIGMNIRDLVPQEYRHVIDAQINLVAQGNPVEGIVEVVTPIGKKTTEYKSNPIWQGGKVVGAQAVLRDITERMKAEEELKASEERYRTLFEQAGDYILILEIPNAGVPIIYDANDYALNVHGYSRDELIGKPITFLDINSSEPEILERIKQLLKNEKITFEAEHRRKDGSQFNAEIINKLVKVGGKDFLLSIERDITERKKTEEDLMKAAKELQTLNEKLRVVGSLTRHDVGNKLMSATSNVFLLKKRLGDNSELGKYVEGIDSAIASAIRIFEFSRLYELIGAEKPSLENVYYCFNEAAKSVPNLGTITVVNECQGLDLIADSLLKQLFHNFIDNSLVHGEKVTQIKLHYKKEVNCVKLFYEDNGVGVSEPIKPKIFEIGFTTGKGTGLGLYLVKKMMDVYGWTIQEIGTSGKGTKFVITIPKTN